MPIVRYILVATDFGGDAHRAVAYAGQLARQLGARLLVLHVDETQAVVPGSDLARRERTADVAGMSALVDELRRDGVDVAGRVVPGVPEREIVAIAGDENVDLIVVGNSGRSGLIQVLLGSVAERVLRRAPCPVLTVREPDTRPARVIELRTGRAV